jgi:hypothetical protein
MSTHLRRWPFLAIVALLAIACGGATGAPSAPPGTGLEITAAAGPVCPVETIPPDPGCEPRLVPNATIVVKDKTGATVATVVTDANGTVLVGLPAGDYVVEPQAAEGLMGTAASEPVTVVNGTITQILVLYDTGIR